jgi:outer membrane lipoprotein-sorting protein
MTPDAEPLGSRQIDGREAVGFRILKKGDGTDIWSGDKTDIWVDVKTKRVVLLETGAADGRWKYILKDFVFDEPLDDSLFTLELPQGYNEKPPGPVYSTTP